MNIIGISMRARMKKAGYMAIGIVAIGLGLVMNSCEIADDLLGNETVSKLEGTWSCTEESAIYKSTMTQTYEVVISADPDNLNGVIIDNFYGVGISVRANVTSTSFIIPNQDTDDDYTVYGSGTISSNAKVITLDYNVDDNSGGQVDEVEAVYTKVD